MIYIGVNLHARHLSMPVLNPDGSIIFDQNRASSFSNMMVVCQELR